MAIEKLITEAQAKRHSDAGVTIVDLRDPVAFRDWISTGIEKLHATPDLNACRSS